MAKKPVTKVARALPTANSASRASPARELARTLIYDSVTWDSEQESGPASLPPQDERPLAEIIGRLALMKDKRGDWVPIFDNGDDFGIWDKLHEELDQAGFIASLPDEGAPYVVECGNGVVTLQPGKFEAAVRAIRDGGR